MDQQDKNQRVAAQCRYKWAIKLASHTLDTNVIDFDMLIDRYIATNSLGHIITTPEGMVACLNGLNITNFGTEMSHPKWHYLNARAAECFLISDACRCNTEAVVEIVIYWNTNPENEIPQVKN